MANPRKWIRKVTKKARAQGWEVKETKKGLMFLAPNGEDIVTVHGTPSDHRAIKNAEAEFKRAGLNL